MGDRAGQVDMTHALTAHLGLGNLDATFFTDYAAVLETLVLAAKTFIVFYRAENLGAEQAVTFRLEGTVVDGFRFFDFTIRP